MSAGSIIVLLLIIAACAGAVIYNVRHHGACDCAGCDGCSHGAASGSSGEVGECCAEDADENFTASANFSCSACPMHGSCNHKK